MRNSFGAEQSRIIAIKITITEPISRLQELANAVLAGEIRRRLVLDLALNAIFHICSAAIQRSSLSRLLK